MLRAEAGSGAKGFGLYEPSTPELRARWLRRFELSFFIFASRWPLRFFSSACGANGVHD
jgi:hypothetical protein